MKAWAAEDAAAAATAAGGGAGGATTPARGTQRPCRESLVAELQRVAGGAHHVLVECIGRGAAFHHAGGHGWRDTA